MTNPYVLGAVLAVALIVFVLFTASRCIRYVGNNRVAIVEKMWSRNGSIAGGLIALNAEAGYQPAVLRGGYHFFVPFQYRVHAQPLVTIPQGQIGYVFARDGAPLGPTQTLASNVRTADFLDVRAFLSNGGQKGPQRTILREGTYAINLAQFVIITREHIYGLMLEANDGPLFAEMQSELPPSEWSIDYDSLDQGRDNECLRRSTSRRRSLASCVRWRSCWAKAARPPKRAGGSRSASRPTIAGARNMVA